MSSQLNSVEHAQSAACDASKLSAIVEEKMAASVGVKITAVIADLRAQAFAQLEKYLQMSEAALRASLLQKEQDGEASCSPFIKFPAFKVETSYQTVATEQKVATLLAEQAAAEKAYYEAQVTAAAAAAEQAAAAALPPPPPLQCACLHCTHYNEKRQKRGWPHKQSPHCTTGRICDCFWCARARSMDLPRGLCFRYCLNNKTYSFRRSAVKPAGFYKE